MVPRATRAREADAAVDMEEQAVLVVLPVVMAMMETDRVDSRVIRMVIMVLSGVLVHLDLDTVPEAVVDMPEGKSHLVMMRQADT